MLSDKCYTGSMHFVCESELGFFLVFHSKQIRMQGEVSASSRSDIDFTVVVSVYPASGPLSHTWISADHCCSAVLRCAVYGVIRYMQTEEF